MLAACGGESGLRSHMPHFSDPKLIFFSPYESEHVLDIKATLRSTLIESLLPNKRERLPVVSSEVKYNQLHESRYSRGARLTSSKDKNSSSVETSLEKEERREKKKEDLLRATGVSSVLCAPPASSPRPDRKEKPSAQNWEGAGAGKPRGGASLNLAPSRLLCLSSV